MKKALLLALTTLALMHPVAQGQTTDKRTPQTVAKQLQDGVWGMFICWSMSTFSGVEWTTSGPSVNFFKATEVDTDQWARVAKESGMGYILFLAKHHDGFCLWDTKTTDYKITNAPLKRDVLRELVASCKKYDIDLALYFSEGDWTWPQRRGTRSGPNKYMKKAQLKELLTEYGDISYIWFDHAAGTGGLNHKETAAFCKEQQPACLIGFNHGEPDGTNIRLGERGKPAPLSDLSGSSYNAKYIKDYPVSNYLLAEFTYPILPSHQGGADWFYSLPKHDNLCHSPIKIYLDYLGAKKYGNIFSINIGPNYAGKIRDIDVKTLTTVGNWIKSDKTLAKGKMIPATSITATASGQWDDKHSATKALDGSIDTRWGAAPDQKTSAWLTYTFDKERTLQSCLIVEDAYDRITQFDLEADVDGTWKTIYQGKKIDSYASITFDKPIKTKAIRLSIRNATDVPTLEEWHVFE